MSSIMGRILTALWPSKSVPPAGIYQLLLKPGISLLSPENRSPISSLLELSLVAKQDYLANLVKETYETMRFLHGNKMPFRVKVISREASHSLRYGLANADHSILLKGDKALIEEFSSRLRETILRDQHEARLDSPQVTGQKPENWLLAANSIPINSYTNSSGGGNGWLKTLGIAGLMLGVVAALAWFSSPQMLGQNSALEAAITHLRKRGAGELQLLSRDLVNGGEKFYFQGPQENYTVIVDKNGHVYSWSRTPSAREGHGLA